MAHDTPRYSLIIATLHDDGDLEHCLASIGELSTPTREFEVIVVDQNGDDRLVAVIARWAPQFTIVHERVSYHAANRARNRGAALASGEWLAFPDDDCTFLPGTLLAVERHASNPDLCAITGRIIDKAGQPHVLRWRASPGAFSRRNMFNCLSEATLFVRRSAFHSIDGFDERFGPGAAYPAAEGIELMNRLFACFGSRCAYYDPAITLAHPRKIPPWNDWAVQRFADYARGEGALIAKHRQAHVILWGLRIFVSATLQSAPGSERSAAFRARIRGLIRGFREYRAATSHGTPG